jgi:serine/threonine-protein phosphatase 6 regulatory ankyrin repeat subunit B
MGNQLATNTGAQLENNMSHPTDHICPVLHVAAQKGHYQCLATLINNGADVNQKDKEWTPLNLAASKGHLECVRLLLANGANINDTSVVTILESITLAPNGVDSNIIKYGGRTPLHMASSHGHSDVIKMLLDHHADVSHFVNNKDTSGWTPLHCASKEGKNACVQMLLEHGADINAKDNEGRTVFEVASPESKEFLIKYQLQNNIKEPTSN